MCNCIVIVVLTIIIIAIIILSLSFPLFLYFHTTIFSPSVVFSIPPFSLPLPFFSFYFLFSSGVVEELLTRRTGKREHEYEVIWEGLGRENSWFSRTELIEMGYAKMLNQKDEQIAMESMLGQRKLTTGEIQKHFDGFGLEPAFAQHTRMGALSGTYTTQNLIEYFILIVIIIIIFCSFCFRFNIYFYELNHILLSFLMNLH